MRKLWKYCVAIVFVATMFFALSLSASAGMYEPDGSTAVEYKFDASECNRTLIVNCVDENGKLLKQVQFQTKRGDEYLANVCLYGYEVIAFQSDQGLLETCKLSWSSVNYVDYASVMIWYYFRTDLSKDVMTATVTLRKCGDITVKTRHYLRTDEGIQNKSNWFWIEETDEQVVSYGAHFTSAAKAFAGHYLMTGYPTQIEGTYLPNGYPALISCDLTYTNIKNAYGFNEITDWMDWGAVEKDLKEEYKEYTTYSEEKDGTMGYCKDRILYLDLYYNRSQYDILFSANGGNGAPATVTQYYGFDITIPDAIPTRTGYFFRGWSTDQRATVASYVAGDTYPVTKAVPFYAVWEKDDYEFSISNLTVLGGEIFPNTIISVMVRTDSWDENDAYANIPVELYYDGRLLATEWLDFDVYGGAYVTFCIDVGTVIGEHEIEVQINRTGIAREGDQTNNSVSTTIHVKRDEYAFGIKPIENNAPYTAGMTVITSYLISNDSERSVLPEAETPVTFTVYYDENGEQVIVNTQSWEGLVIPIGEQNLVYFKWTVPTDIAGTEIFCTCTVNGDGTLKENNRDNNTATLTTVVADRVFSQTPNPIFATNTPNGYSPQSVPAKSVGSASWTVWEYENGVFVLKKYGIKIADGNPQITPDGNCTSATYGGGVWTMKSGYGITLNFAPTIVVLNGCNTPDQSSYTDTQSVYATFSEYGYSTDAGEYRDLVLINGEWYFAENESADQNDRIHYIPLWLSDGEYVVSVTLTELWTPVGRITAVRSSNVILIDGSLYDDWYN